MAVLLRIFGALLLVTALALALSRAPDRPVETLVARCTCATKARATPRCRWC